MKHTQTIYRHIYTFLLSHNHKVLHFQILEKSLVHYLYSKQTFAIEAESESSAWCIFILTLSYLNHRNLLLHHLGINNI